jgi:hypothetical protein
VRGHSVGNNQTCQDGKHLEGVDNCVPDGQHMVGDGYTCADGRHREGSECILDGQHSVGNGHSCPIGQRAAPDFKCIADTTPELPPHRLESNPRVWHWDDSRPLPVPQGDYVRADEGALSCMRRAHEAYVTSRDNPSFGGCFALYPAEMLAQAKKDINGK